ncbi:mavicyanin-like [Salvia divinorum]|uniref:Mavicyanin-like n=1 Tax=Salvia divinorum TaxID=28513 RepID=A0ABD1HW41_SALDI
MGRRTILIALVVVLLVLWSSEGLQHRVGDSIWSIPPTNNFYKNWSSSYIFHTGDTLYFDFDSGLYNVLQVSRGEFDMCTGYEPYKTFIDGPATIPLLMKGVFYYVCNVSNYCALGLKLWVIVEQT